MWTDKNPVHGVDAAERITELVHGAAMHVAKLRSLATVGASRGTRHYGLPVLNAING